MFWLALYLFHPGARRVMRWMLLLFLAFAAFVFINFATRPARAAVPVIDEALSAITQKLGIEELVNQVKSITTELQQLQQEVQMVQEWAYITENIIHDPSLGSVMQAANALGLSSSLPLNPYAIQGLLAGGGGIGGINSIMGRLNGLSGLVNGSYTSNRLYNCQTGDPGCQLAQVSAASRAASNGIAAKMLSDISDHLGVLQGLRTRLATATDPKTVADAQAQISTESAWLTGAQGQLQSIAIMQASQEQAFGQAATQKFVQDADAFIKAARAVQ